MPEFPLILASQSPRRRELLRSAGYVFDVLTPDEHAEDTRKNGETPEDYVCRLAKQKARNVADRLERAQIIGCDTIAVCRGEILGKPADRDDARKMLQMLRGSEHRVLSGLCLLRKDGPIQSRVVRCDVTRLFMRPILDWEIEDYLDTDDWQGKAGAFGYQDGHAWITIVEGSESNVVGLPMELLAAVLVETNRKDTPHYGT